MLSTGFLLADATTGGSDWRMEVSAQSEHELDAIDADIKYTLQRLFRRRRNFLASPLLRPPAELILKIFVQAVELDNGDASSSDHGNSSLSDNSPTRVVISAIYHQLRGIKLTSPQLWGTVGLAVPPTPKLFLKRCKHGLHILTKSRPVIESGSMCLAIIPGGNINGSNWRVAVQQPSLHCLKQVLATVVAFQQEGLYEGRAYTKVSLCRPASSVNGPSYDRSTKFFQSSTSAFGNDPPIIPPWSVNAPNARSDLQVSVLLYILWIPPPIELTSGTHIFLRYVIWVTQRRSVPPSIRTGDHAVSWPLSKHRRHRADYVHEPDRLGDLRGPCSKNADRYLSSNLVCMSHQTGVTSPRIHPLKANEITKISTPAGRSSQSMSYKSAPTFSHSFIASKASDLAAACFSSVALSRAPTVDDSEAPLHIQVYSRILRDCVPSICFGTIVAHSKHFHRI
jgi:hypothetical protein